ncbi:hypothetical protein QVG61_06735 [Thiohalobacter sp. IOR34]|uniref:hypothetical protein n=1 Tax=Thiohalobacter sp. IOR34 TaxID=3057176 RepID=UPI0025B02F4E|nr:hypothetical protein [Thiohalobacter sp. IOR34]WJW76772.1 hypothetical protein QVG61_06735 [Thiohalobacter sp. IOR34]
MILRRLFLASALLLAALPGARAEVLIIDALKSEPPNSPAGLERPRSGQTMEAVRARFGEPQQILGPVGEPPITRWVYQDFTVYFEGSRVIHSVLHRPHAP